MAGRAGLASSRRCVRPRLSALPPAQARTLGRQPPRPPPLCSFGCRAVFPLRPPAPPACSGCVLLGSVPREPLLLQLLHLQLLSCLLCVCLAVFHVKRCWCNRCIYNYCRASYVCASMRCGCPRHGCGGEPPRIRRYGITAVRLSYQIALTC